ncbi:MAG: hypothetical protein HYY04_00365 [Chloroflexi bacterium]|nr:hypothetical protein [Chloroflexota bacterium]
MATKLSSTERVMAAISFREPDRVPVFFRYWPEFTRPWRQERPQAAAAHQDGRPAPDPAEYYGNDVYVATPDETPWPSRAAKIGRSGDYVVKRDGWGRVTGTREGSSFYDELELPLPDKHALDRLEFESPADDRRYEAALKRVRERQSGPNPPCIFIKVGGPYLRTSNLRGIEQWLVDIAEDPEFASALASKVTDHIIQVGLEMLRRTSLGHPVVGIYDDVGCNRGPMVSPASYERIFLPPMRRMIQTFKRAGARWIFMHTDGNVLPLLDGLVEAGLNVLDPVEPKAGMDVVALREKYGDCLAYSGGMDNAHILPRGADEEVRRHVLRVLGAGRGGGLIIGCHSIGHDVSVDRLEYVLTLIREHGGYPLQFG